jgi:hypothetical protein
MIGRKGNAPVARADIDASLDAALEQLDKLEMTEPGDESSGPVEVPPYQSGTRRVARKNLPPFPGSGLTLAVPPLPSPKPRRSLWPLPSREPRARANEPSALPLVVDAPEPRPRRWLGVVAGVLGLMMIAAGLALGAAHPMRKGVAKTPSPAPAAKAKLPDGSLSAARMPSAAPRQSSR